MLLVEERVTERRVLLKVLDVEEVKTPNKNKEIKASVRIHSMEREQPPNHLSQFLYSLSSPNPPSSFATTGSKVIPKGTFKNFLFFFI